MSEVVQVWKCGVSTHPPVKLYVKANAAVCGRCASQHPTGQKITENQDKWTMKLVEGTK